MSEKKKIYWTLFTSTFYVSALMFGSGFVILSVLKKRFVDELEWVDEKEMTNLISLAQSSPGLVIANTTFLIGYKMCGYLGALVAILGMAIPPLITIYIISIFYNLLRDNTLVNAVLMGMQAGACAVLCEVLFSLYTTVVKDKSLQMMMKWGIMIGAFIAAYIFHINFSLIVLFFICLGIALHYGKRGTTT
jgi:Chromate transport protein ChrA